MARRTHGHGPERRARRHDDVPAGSGAPAAEAVAQPPQSAAAYPSVRIADGHLLVPVHVVPRAGREALALEAGALRVHVTAPPVDGAANAAVTALLADRLGLPRRAIEVVRGASARHKTVAIAGLDPDELWRRLAL